MEIMKRWYLITVVWHDKKVAQFKKRTTYDDALGLPTEVLRSDLACVIKYIYVEEFSDDPTA